MPSAAETIFPALPERLTAARLPDMPDVARQVSRLALSPLTDISEIVRVIRSDTELTATLLRVANSTYYGIPRRIESLSMAVVVLGLRELCQLVTSISVMRVFRSDPRFWEHAAGCGEAARLLAARLHLRLDGNEFTAGLLHDVGKLVLAQALPEEAARAAAESGSLTAAERKYCGCDHAEAGAWLAEHWHLPGSVVEAIRCHHRPQDAPHAPVLAAVIRLGDLMDHALRDGTGRAALRDAIIHDPAWDLLASRQWDVVRMDVIRFVDELEENFQRARELVHLAVA